ncbi:MAG: hypothetical protein ACYC5O_12325 [Anaerolineae bacterium]
MARTVVAMYDSVDEARDAVHDLQQVGFMADSISLVTCELPGGPARAEHPEGAGSRAAEGVGVGGGIGAVLGGAAGLLVGLGTLAIPGVGPVVAAGPLLAALAGAGTGATAGGIVGALIGAGIPEHEAQAYAEGVRRGGTLVSVNAPDADADRAATVMQRFNPVDIERRSDTWRGEGWERFDQYARPFTGEQMERERSRSASDVGDRPSTGM